MIECRESALVYDLVSKLAGRKIDKYILCHSKMLKQFDILLPHLFPLSCENRFSEPIIDYGDC